MLFVVIFVIRVFKRSPGLKIIVIFTQLKTFLIESRRTFTDVDMMVPTNLVGIFCF